jgi:serine/threonine-protein kinase
MQPEEKLRADGLATQDAQLAGRVVDNKYRLEEIIGQGASAVVYRASRLDSGEEVAVKFLKRDAMNPEAIERLRREGIALSRLKHPNIVQIIAYGGMQSRPFIVMPYISAPSLSKLLDQQGGRRLSLDHALPIFAQILDALSCAHEQDILHRDLNPRNVLILPDDKVKVVDFGTARFLEDSGRLQTLTQTGEVVGSLPYMSPEQCTGRALDARSDLYSMGCLMYEVLTGEPPFAGATQFELMTQHLQTKPRQRADIDRRMQDLIAAALSKDPNGRPSTAAEFKERMLSKSNATRSSRVFVFAGMALLACMLISALAISRYPVTKPADNTAPESAWSGCKLDMLLERALVADPKTSEQMNRYVFDHASPEQLALKAWAGQELASSYIKQGHLNKAVFLLEELSNDSAKRQDLPLEDRIRILKAVAEINEKLKRSDDALKEEQKALVLCEKLQPSSQDQWALVSAIASEVCRHLHQQGKLDTMLEISKRYLSRCEPRLHTGALLNCATMHMDRMGAFAERGDLKSAAAEQQALIKTMDGVKEQINVNPLGGLVMPFIVMWESHNRPDLANQLCQYLSKRHFTHPLFPALCAEVERKLASSGGRKR